MVILNLVLVGRASAADNFPGTTISGSFGSLIDTTVGMTGETGETATPGGGALTTQWYTWTAPSTGTVVMGTCNPTTNSNTTTDTTIAIYTGATVAALGAAVASNDDGPCVSTVNASYASLTSFAATAGTVYHIQMDTYDTSVQGNFNFYWGYVNTTASVTTTITDNSTTEGADTAAFTTVLNTLPSGTVTITLGANARCTYAPSTLTFTVNNWNTPQTVTVTAVNDLISQGPGTCAPATMVANGGGFANLALTPPTVNVLDNDAAINVVTTDNAATETAGNTGAFTVVLGNIPTATATVTIGTSTQCTFSPSTLTFTTVNWNVAQTVTATPIDDTVVEGNHTCSPATISGANGGYTGVNGTVPTINITDNDSATVSIVNTSNGAEAGSVAGVMTLTQTKTSSTNTVISYTVGGTATSGSDYTALSGSVTILAGSTTATINIPVINDLVVDPGETVIITLTVISAGQPAITLLAPLSATNTILDNDIASLTETKSVNQANITSPQTLTYTITVTNTGNIPLTGPIITDVLAQGSALTLSSGPSLTSGDAAPLGQLDVSEVWLYTATYNVTQANIDNGANITNSSTFKTNETILVTSNTTTTTITRTPQLTIIKTADTAGPVPAGTVITYSYVITNSGNVTMTTVTPSDTHNGTGIFVGPSNEGTLVDAAPLGDSSDAAVNGIWDALGVSDKVTFNATYTVTQNDVDYLQ